MIIEKKSQLKPGMNLILPGIGSFHTLMNNLNTNIGNTTSSAVLCSLHGRKTWLTTFMNGGNAYNTNVVVSPPC